MTEKRILIVEDERVVAEDIRRLLGKMGYTVVGAVSDGEQAIEKAKTMKPDLILMDIRIQGPLDGIEVAEYIYTHLEIPVCFLTAYADEPTLERAKATMPFGYLLKPFDPRSLQTAVELAIYRQKMERTLTDINTWHARALQSLGAAVIGSDKAGHVTFMNRSAEKMTGWSLDALLGKPIRELFWENGKRKGFMEHDATARNGQEFGGILITKDGNAVPVMYTCAYLNDQGGAGVGNLYVLRRSITSEVEQKQLAD